LTNYKKSNASGSQAAGIYQLAVALNFLMKITYQHGFVGVETLDDVSVGDVDGTTLAQLKHTVNEDKNLLADTSKNLWKTLAIWLSYLKEEKPNIDQCSFLFVTNGTVPTKSLIGDFAAGTGDLDKAKDVLKKLRAIKSKDESAQAFIEEVLSHPDDQLLALIPRVSVLSTPTGDANNLKQDTILHMQCAEGVDKDAVYNETYGWFTSEIFSMWKATKAAWISRQSLTNCIDSISKKNCNLAPYGLTEAALLPTEQDVKYSEEENFVTHIKKINLGSDVIHEAIRDHFRYLTTRSKLTGKGIVTPQQWETTALDLKESWQSIHQEAKYTAPKDHDAVQVGTGVFYKTIRQTKKIGGAECAKHMVPGFYHYLANDDEVWWHPEYLPEKKKSDD
jgi:hypothetical protein